MNNKVHTLKSEAIAPPRFTYPFCYEPHPLCLAAAEEVRHYLSSHPEWQQELSEGKMLGVLVVTNGETKGFLAAFSGTLDCKTQHEYFVPPVFDLMKPECHFQKEQERISAINHRIAELQSMIVPSGISSEAERAIHLAQDRMHKAKMQRDALRCTLSADELQVCQDDLIRQSQFLKAELKRTKDFWTQKVREAEKANDTIRQQIELLQVERQKRSQVLQQWLFGQINFLNAKGERKGVRDIFENALPPSGAGDCCGPKLLQYAYLHNLHPLCMAEFWIGASPREEIRTDGNFYPACRNKCLPILTFMMEGLQVDENPLLQYEEALEAQLRIVYQGCDYIVISKPSGMLSVPGRDALPSVFSLIKTRYPQASGPMIVHRLDMDTSGLMAIALTDEAYHRMQNLFTKHQVKKTYLALLQKPMQEGLEGTVRLPLRPDYADRPRQRVDIQYGHRAITYYHVLRNIDGHALVAMQPETGRTHQLRVHCAHIQGLNNPIVGDRLYGIPDKRLMLHAWRLSLMGMTFQDNWQELHNFKEKK